MAPTLSLIHIYNFTGWVWNDRDRYYVVDNSIVTGWQYIDGYKYYFEGDGRLVTDLEPDVYKRQLYGWLHLLPAEAYLTVFLKMPGTAAWSLTRYLKDPAT